MLVSSSSVPFSWRDLVWTIAVWFNGAASITAGSPLRDARKEVRSYQAEAAYSAAAAGLAAAGDQQAQLHTLQALSRLQLKQNRPLEAAATLSAGQANRSIPGRILRSLLRLPAKFLRS